MARFRVVFSTRRGGCRSRELGGSRVGNGLFDLCL